MGNMISVSFFVSNKVKNTYNVSKRLSMGDMQETHNMFPRFSPQKHQKSVGKTLWKSQNMSRNGFFQRKHHLVPAVYVASHAVKQPSIGLL